MGRQGLFLNLIVVITVACGDTENPNTDTANPSVDGGVNAMLDQGVGPNADGSVASDMSVASDQGMAMTDVFVVMPADSGTAQTPDDDMPADARVQVDAAQSDQGTPAPDAGTGTCTLTCAAWSQLNEVNCVCEEVDDCLDNNGGCHRNSTCLNHPSIYEPPACTCDEGEGYWPAGRFNFETCRPFTVCTENEYETAAPTPTSDRECTALTQCPPGSPEVTPPTATSDRVCGIRNDPDADGIFGLRGITRTEIFTGESLEHLAAADFDEDGDMDLLWYGGWLRNDSLPLKVDTFTERDLDRSIHPDVELSSFIRKRIYATDFTPRSAATGPHSTDLIFVGRGVVIFKNLGNESMRVEPIETVQDVYDPRVTKWLADDAQDLLFYKGGGSDLRLIEPTRNGTYQDSLLIEDVRNYQICGANEGQRGVIYVDNRNTYWATMTSQAGGYQFQSTIVNSSDFEPHACGDFNGDGRSEALVQGYVLDRDTRELTNHVYIIERAEGARTWTLRQFFDKQGVVKFAKAIDLEGDGDQDLIVTYAGPEFGDPRETFIYENSGNNEFNEIAVAELMDGEHQLPVGGIWTDFDDDGVVDVISSDNSGVFLWRFMWNDNCPSIANPDQADLNNDDRGDPCSFDVDLDTVHDRVDNCRTTENTDQSDLDADGIGDACDPDIDGDGIRNVRETLFGTNPELADSDGDGIGDFIELNCGDDGCPDEPADTDGDDANDANDTDADNDGVLDGADNCRVHVNADQANLDGDTFGDSCDVDADGDLVEQGGDCDDFNPFAASLTWDSDCDGYADEIGKDRHLLRTYRSRERERINNGAVSSSETIWSSSRIAWRGEKIFTADIDGDGDIDVIPRDGYVYYNDGGPISTYPSYRLYNLYPEIDWVADLNADGYPEFITTNNNGLTIYQNLNDFTQLVHDPNEEPWNQYRIDGAFSALTPVSHVNEAMQAACDSVWLIQTSGDLDGDGDEDFITTCTQNDDMGAIAWHENQDNTLNFTSHLLLSGLHTPNTPHVVDFNGDGHRDIVFAAIEADPTRDINDGYVAWLRNDGANNFTQSVLVPEIGDDFRFGTISYLQGKVSVAVADMDGDGDLDIITNTDANVYGAEWWENDGGVDPALVDDHLIKVQPSIDDDEGMLGPFEVHDVDRDGLVDVVANYKYWFKQRPNGAFQTEYVSNGGEDMIFGAIYDVNGDGHLDVFVNEGRTRNDNNYLRWYRMYALDNCPDVSNADQLDTDGDFVGDVCE